MDIDFLKNFDPLNAIIVIGGILYIKSKFDTKIESLEKKVDALAGKIAQVDLRLIEVERHLFALRAVIHYNPDEKKEQK